MISNLRRHPMIKEALRGTGVLFVLLASAGVAVASSGEGAPGAAPSPFSKEMLFRTINFIVLLVILLKFLAKPIGDFLSARREEILSKLEEAKRSKEAAEARYAELAQRLANRDQEFEEIRRNAEENAARLKERIIVEAQENAKRIEEKTKASIEQELKKAQETLKVEAAELALKLSQEKLLREIKPEDHQRFVDSYIADLK
jgi:F-type H+-transporting ATPase subunit b